MLGFCALIFAALGVVVQLKDALNTVWEVEPPKASSVWSFVRTYMVSLAAVLSLGFLLLISLLLTTALASCPLFAQDHAVQDSSIESENATINFFTTVSLLFG